MRKYESGRETKEHGEERRCHSGQNFWTLLRYEYIHENAVHFVHGLDTQAKRGDLDY